MVRRHGREQFAAHLSAFPLPQEVRGHGPPAAPHVPMDGGFAQGGAGHDQTSILAASGEVVVPPEDVQALGERMIRDGRGKRGEDAMSAGHRGIDEAIDYVRKFVINWTKHAPKPKA